jgi:hypothetical protein
LIHESKIIELNQIKSESNLNQFDSTELFAEHYMQMRNDIKKKDKETKCDKENIKLFVNNNNINKTKENFKLRMNVESFENISADLRNLQIINCVAQYRIKIDQTVPK